MTLIPQASGAVRQDGQPQSNVASASGMPRGTAGLPDEIIAVQVSGTTRATSPARSDVPASALPHLETQAFSTPRATGVKLDPSAPSAPSAIELNQVPEKIAFENLAMHRTNLNVVLDALHAGGQLRAPLDPPRSGGRVRPVKNDPQGVAQRVNCHSISVGLDISNAFYHTRSHATDAARHDPTVNLNRPSEVPIVVIGDGMDTWKRERSNLHSPTEGVLRRRGIGDEIAFERLNIRALLCQDADEDYVVQMLKDAGFERPVHTYTSFAKLQEKTLIGVVLSYDPGPEVRRYVVEALTGAEYPDCPKTL